MYLLCIFLKFLHYYFYRIGNLLIIIQQDLFTDYLVDKKTGRLISPLILIKIRRGIRQEVFDPLHHIVYIKLRSCRNRNNFSLRKQLFPLFYQFHKLFLISQVYFINQQQNRRRLLTYFLNKFVILIRSFNHVCHIKQDICISQC